MRHFALLLVLAFIHPLSFSEEGNPTNEIRVSAWYSEGRSPDGDGPRWYVTCYIENNGPTAQKVVVGKPSRVVDPQVRFPILFSFEISRTPDGRKVRQPNGEFGIVNLQPGESALLGDIRILELDTEGEPFAVRYRVSKEVGQFYGTWYGEVEATPKEVGKAD